jgi:hypothetical protein
LTYPADTGKVQSTKQSGSFMRKEFIIAILAGLSLGLIIAFGVRTAQTSLKNRIKANKSDTTSSSIQANSQTNASHTLLITAPIPDQIVTDSDLNIVGSTTPNSMVSIVGTGGIETSTLADDTGSFNAPVTLTAGVNSLVVTSFNPDGDQSESSFNVVFSSADLSATSSAKAKK